MPFTISHLTDSIFLRSREFLLFISGTRYFIILNFPYQRLDDYLKENNKTTRSIFMYLQLSVKKYFVFYTNSEFPLYELTKRNENIASLSKSSSDVKLVNKRSRCNEFQSWKSRIPEVKIFNSRI